MILFFNKKQNQKDENFIKIAALLIHTAKIDQDYSKNEEKIIKEALLKIGISAENIEQTITSAKELETNSNQILDFTKEVKKMENEDKKMIVETLWKIIYSNKEADIYETSLMRRLAGLLYIDSKVMGDIKEQIKKEIK